MPRNPEQNQGVATRVAAARLLEQVFARKATIDDALEHVGARFRLKDDDRRLVHAISGFVFRRLPEIDAILRLLMNRARDPDPATLHSLLRVGVAQLLYMDVPAHAAVDTAVSACGSLGLTRQKALVNAVLRSVQRRKEELLADAHPALGMLPSWLKARWITAYGQSGAEEIAKACAAEAPLDLGIKDAQASLEWAQKLGGEVVIPGTVRIRQRAGHIVSWPGFAEGSWWVQDLAASLPIRMLGNVAGKSLVDVCAAPGGKAIQAACAGARVSAIDVSASRMDRVTENAQRLKLADAIQTVVADACRWTPPAHPDIVVLDAPCSATGTLRRHPELPWIHEEKDIAQLKVMQHELLSHCAFWLGHDGILLYCTCSLEPEEGESQVESFLARNKDFKEIKSIPTVVHPFLRPGINNTGFRTNPALSTPEGGMDGFFMALLQKQ